MYLEQRVLHGSVDISAAVNDFRTGSYTFAYTAGDFLYVGSLLPFNNLWVEVGTPNAVSTAVSVDIWYANAWTPAVDIIDETNALFNTGRLQWRPDESKGWDVEQYSRDVTGLPSTSRIYNFYWIRLSWANTLTATMTLKYIGQKFATDSVLYSFYPDLNNTDMRTSFASGKTTWDEQHYMAAEHIVRDLKKRGIITTRNQILDASLLTDASCHRLAMMVYTAMGTPYFDQLEQAKKDYSACLNMNFFTVDKNATGDIEPIERVLSTTFVTR